MMRFRLRSVIVALALSAARATPTAWLAASATPTFTVNSTSDVVASAPLDNGICETAPGNGTCTLRAAIMKANHWPGGGATILLPALPTGASYTLTIPRSGASEANGALKIKANVTIQGSGASDTIIDGNRSHTNDSVFYVTATTVAVTMTGVTIRGGGSGFHGGIANGGNLVLYNSAIVANQAITGLGGGILNGGTLTVYTSTVSGNQGSFGGGIANDQGTVMLIATTVSSNTANIDGGGLWNNTNVGFGGDSSVTLVNSTVSGNTAGSDGGGISNLEYTVLVNSTVSGNMAGRNGGGISSPWYTKLVNSTVSGNSAAGDGGGIWNDARGYLTLFNATIAHDLAGANHDRIGAGGGIFNVITGTVQLRNSLLADNLASDYDPDRQVYFGVPNDCHGPLASNDYNLVSDTANCTFSASPNDQTNVDPVLGPLQDNGGPTWTHALLPGSPAIDAGNLDRCRDSLGVPLATDQRGFPRHANGAGTTRCDIGAYEVQRLLNLPLVIR